MKYKIVLLISVLLAAFGILLFLLIYWGGRAVDLQKNLFEEEVNLALNGVADKVENESFCFRLNANFDVAKTDSFFVKDFISGYPDSLIPFYYTNFNGNRTYLPIFPLLTDASLILTMEFEFKDIPNTRSQDSISDFEEYIRNVYDSSIIHPNGKLLTNRYVLRKSILSAMSKIDSTAQYHYQLIDTRSQTVIYSSDTLQKTTSQEGLYSTMIFNQREDLPTLELRLVVTNLNELFHREIKVIYSSGILLTGIISFVLYLFYRIHHQQKTWNQKQRDFIHGITHELNTPIANIQLTAQKLNNGVTNLPKLAEILLEEGKKLQSGINILLTTALIEKDEILLQKEEVEITLFVKQILNKTKTWLHSAGMKLIVTCRAKEVVLQIDRFHIENVLQNLLMNARKHSEATQVEVLITEESEVFSISITDNGKGLDRGIDSENIFNKFYGVSKATDRNGFGLGLYYSRMIAELHGGRLEYIKTEAQGATFKLSLPYG